VVRPKLLRIVAATLLICQGENAVLLRSLFKWKWISLLSVTSLHFAEKFRMSAEG
jgi:hypothetical protein